MGFLDFTDADLIALTRQRRLERAAQLEIEEAHTKARAPTLRLSVTDLQRINPPSGLKAKPNPRPPTRRRKRPREGFEAARCPHKFWRVWDAQAGRCFLCPDDFTPDDWPTWEHVRPRSTGGDRRGNVLLAHSDCNNRKGRRDAYPCEMIFLVAINERLPKVDEAGWLKRHGVAPFIPLRQRLAVEAAE